MAKKYDVAWEPGGRIGRIIEETKIMTPAELAKVRELVGAQRAMWVAECEHHDELSMATDRFYRAFLAVEAMVAEHQTEEPQS